MISLIAPLIFSSFDNSKEISMLFSKYSDKLSKTWSSSNVFFFNIKNGASLKSLGGFLSSLEVIKLSPIKGSPDLLDKYS